MINKNILFIIIYLAAALIISCGWQHYEEAYDGPHTIPAAGDKTVPDKNYSLTREGIDEIILEDNTSIKCTVISVSSKEIVYTTPGDPDRKSLPAKSVKRIAYNNGKSVSANQLYLETSGFLSFSIRSVYSEYEEKNFAVYAYMGPAGINLQLMPVNDENSKGDIEYQQQDLWNFGVSLNYSGLGISLSKATVDRNTDEPGEKNMKYEYNDFQLFYYSRQYGIDLLYQDYKGYEIANFDAFDYAQMTDEVVFRSDIRIKYIRLDCYYSFNNDFSLAAAFRQTNVQQTGFYASFLIMLSGSYWSVSGDSSLIVPEEEVNYADYAGLHEVTNTSFTVLPGYALSIATKIMSVSVCGFIGIGYNSQDFKTSQGGKSINGQIVKKNIRTNCRIDFWDPFFWGFWVIAEHETTYGNSHDIPSLDLDNLTLECYAGFRF